MRYLSHARPVVRDLSSVCPTVRLPTLSHLPHQRSTPRSATTTPHSPTTSTAATRSSAWSSSPSSSSSVATPARAPSRRPSESSRACTSNQPCHVVDHGCPASCCAAPGQLPQRQRWSRGGDGLFKQRASCDSRGHSFPIFHASRASPPLHPAGFEPRIPCVPNSGDVPCVSFPHITCELALAPQASAERRRMRVRLPSSTIEDGLPSPSKSKPARASLLHRLLNKHIILLLMLALTVRRSSHTCKCAPS